MAVPKLRFKDFDQNWTGLKIKDLVKSLDAGVSVNSEEVEPQEYEYSVLKTSCISSGYFDENERKRVLQDGEIQRLKEPVLDDSILMSRMNTPLLVGMNAYVFKAPKNTFLPDRLWQLKIDNNKTVTRWLAFYLGSDQGLNQIRDLASGTSNSMKNITKPDVLNIDLFAPQKEEQTKIASFLSNVDEKISQLTQKHALLSQYKQGMMQKLFSQQLRFKADDGSEFGEWEDKPLNEIASKRSGKNKDGSISEVLTNSATQGIIKQSDYFEREIVTESNLNGYYIVNLDDFVYNPRISVHAPVGPIKRNKKCLGVMSPLYTVFTVIQGNLKYLEYFFDSNFWHDYVKGVANSGARHDRMNITNKDFFDMPILYPCLEEQTKIANFLSAIDQKIEVVAQQIEQAKTWKKGLLQQMFM